MDAATLPAEEQITSVQVSQAALIWRRFRKQRRGVIGLMVLVLLALSVLIIPFFSPYDYNAPNVALVLAPAWTTDIKGNLHILGTDPWTRDEFTRLFYGGRISLSMALITATVVIVVGSIIGALAGALGGWVDTLLMRITDFMLALPLLPMYVLLLRLFKPDPMEEISVPRELFKLGAVFVLFSWMGIARLVRGSMLSLRTRTFVEASRALGASDKRIIFAHLLPNAIAPVLVAATFVAGDYIIWESVLAYFGQGLEDTIAPSWGNLVTGAQGFVGGMHTLNPFKEIDGYLLIFPTFFIFVSVLCLNYVGDALRDALDPHT